MSYFVLLADFLHRGAITTNIDKLNRRQKSSAACYITYAVTLIKLLFPKNAECPEMKKKQQSPLQYPVLFLSQYNQSHQFLPVLPHEYRLRNPQLQSVSYEIADQIQEKCGVEVRVAVPGHTQRGGSPCPYGRVLCTRLGSAAAQAIMDGKFGYMIAMINNKTKCVPLGEVAGKLKTVDPDSQMIQEAKRIGISFGD